MKVNLRKWISLGAVICAAAALLVAGGHVQAKNNFRGMPADKRADMEKGIRAKSTQFGLPFQGIVNSELWHASLRIGWMGSGRGMSPTMSVPSHTYPAGSVDSPLWSSAPGIIAYEPGLPNSGNTNPGESDNHIGTKSVYRNLTDVHIPIYDTSWFVTAGPSSNGGGEREDIGVAGTANLATYTGYKEPFVTEVQYMTSAGVLVTRQTYSFSWGYHNLNDAILMRWILTNTGDVDVDIDGTLEATDNVLEAFAFGMVYDYDIVSELSPVVSGLAGWFGGDDKTPPGFLRGDLVDERLKSNSITDGRYTGGVWMFDEDDPGISGDDSGIWSNNRRNWVGAWHGPTDILILEGDGTGANGDLHAPVKKTIWGGPSVGLFKSHTWWASAESPRNAEGWFDYAISTYYGSYPGDGGQPSTKNTAMWANPRFFEAGAGIDVTAWQPKAGLANYLAADPRRLDPRLPDGTYDNGGPLYASAPGGPPVHEYAPDAYTGSDRKDQLSGTGCNRCYIGYGPFNLGVGESMTLWNVDVLGVNIDGAYDVTRTARDVWMQRKFNPAAGPYGSYYWDGSNERSYDGALYNNTAGVVAGPAQNAGPAQRSSDPWVVPVRFPPPAPKLTVSPTNDGGVKLEWEDNAEVADPVNGDDFDSYYVYRASGFIDLDEEDPSNPIGYNNGIAWTPYGEGNTIMYDFGFSGVPSFVTADVNQYAQAGFPGPYIRIAQFSKDGGANTLSPDAGSRSAGVVERNAALGATTATKSGTKYTWIDRDVLIGFNYWYYVAAVDNETGVDPQRYPDGLESFLTMNANGSDGLWHNQMPFRGRVVGPAVPGQEIIPSVPIAANTAEKVVVAPNPFSFQAQWDLGAQAQSVRFFNIPVPGKIFIYDTAGTLVKRIDIFDTPEQREAKGTIPWNLRNQDNLDVAPGLYICYVVNEKGTPKPKTIKLYVSR